MNYEFFERITSTRFIVIKKNDKDLNLKFTHLMALAPKMGHKYLYREIENFTSEHRCLVQRVAEVENTG